MIPREIAPYCLSLSQKYPVITITGPRQSGKTTLAKSVFPDKRYVNFEDPDTRLAAREDPRGFLSRYPEGAIFDEIQHVPEIPSYIQGIVDASDSPGRFIFTGSQQFEITHSINQSLAGRTALFKLLPLSMFELAQSGIDTSAALETVLLKGFYPRVFKDNIPPNNYFMNYFETYVQRDIRQLSQIENLHVFEKFVRMLASRIGQLLNYSSLANDLGVSQPTIKHWISILEASYIIFVLQPYHGNIGKRLIKTPKIYFTDTGLASYLSGISSAESLQLHPMRGPLFENLVISEFLKRIQHSVLPARQYFYRDKTGNEADLLIEAGGKLNMIEIKSSATLAPSWHKNLSKIGELLGDKVQKQAIVYGGTSPFTIDKTDILPWRSLPETASSNLF